MKCEWDAYLNLLPTWMRGPVDKHGRTTLQELRLRIGIPPELVMQDKSVWLTQCVLKEDITYCINASSGYSPWSVATSARGYITALGGHRIGLCGSVISEGEQTKGLRSVSSLCIRVARDFPGIAKQAADIHSSILILGSPGSGKTTLLRDLIRLKSQQDPGSVAVVDEKGEIFPLVQEQPCFPMGKKTDILSGCRKTKGIEMLLRNMSPHTIAVDEITAEEDCRALLHAGWCGVKLYATAHAMDLEDFLHRPVYRPLLESKLFGTVLVMQPDKTWKKVRISI